MVKGWKPAGLPDWRCIPRPSFPAWREPLVGLWWEKTGFLGRGPLAAAASSYPASMQRAGKVATAGGLTTWAVWVHTNQLNLVSTQAHACSSSSSRLGRGGLLKN